MAKAPDTTPPLVMIEWEDACALDTETWADNGPVKYEAKTFKQVGFLLYDGKEGIILTAAWSPDKVAPRDQIPRGMVRKITKLRP